MKIALYAVISMLLTSEISVGRSAIDQSRDSASEVAAPNGVPAYCTAEHNVGNMAMSITNQGVFGSGMAVQSIDCFTGRTARSCQYPKDSTSKYLFGGAIWVGGIVGSDTLVSVAFDGWELGFEMHPDAAPSGNIQYRSTIGPVSTRVGAVSQQDFLTEYFDTCRTGCFGLSNDATDHRPHIPLGLRVKQRTFMWNEPFLENLVLLDLQITNMSANSIQKGFVGIYVDADVFYDDDVNGFGDDYSGYFSQVTVPDIACAATLESPTAWSADNDGDLEQWKHHAPHVTATTLLKGPSDGASISFNWWGSNSSSYLDYGPTRLNNARDFGTGATGTPTGDRNKYWLLSNGDIDFDQPFVWSITPTDSVWQYPSRDFVYWYWDGSDTKYLLSVGPFDLSPGESVPLVFAYVAGKRFHTDSLNFGNLPLNPGIYESHLNFEDLKKNIVWANWVYDNPGVDTDSDGYAGPYVVCDNETTYVKGDGVPDFRASVAPPRPVTSASAGSGSITLRWNGAASELSRDFLTRAPNFEGYNVYLKNSGDAFGFQKVASYDAEDYFKARYDASNHSWLVSPVPLTGADLRCMYAPGGCGDTMWSATEFVRTHPFVLPGFADSIFYFVPVGCNASRFGFETPILKSYPEAPKPRWKHASDVPPDSASLYLTDDGKFKYYEYELTLENLTPVDTYYVSVTAFDFGRATLGDNVLRESPVDFADIMIVPLAKSNCCAGITGNVDCSPTGSIDIADLTALIDYLYISLSPPCCTGEANIDGDAEGVIDISDLTQLIDFLYINFAVPAGCQ